MFSKLIIVFLFLFLNQNLAVSQQVIKLQNPSFEDTPRHSKPPTYWDYCGDSNESPPDVQPKGGFGVSKEAANGNTYLGMVVRDNNTWEAVGQSLSEPLNAEQCYDFSLFLARSNRYISVSRTTEGEVHYTTPIKIRIWGGNNPCSSSEILAETDLIGHTDWLKYNFRFHTKEAVQYLIIEAYYGGIALNPYNGNILIDAASDIVAVDCDTSYSKKPKNTEIYIQQITLDKKDSYGTFDADYKEFKPNINKPNQMSKHLNQKVLKKQEDIKRFKSMPPTDVRIKNTSFESLNMDKKANDWKTCDQYG